MHDDSTRFYTLPDAQLRRLSGRRATRSIFHTGPGRSFFRGTGEVGIMPHSHNIDTHAVRNSRRRLSFAFTRCPLGVLSTSISSPSRKRSLRHRPTAPAGARVRVCTPVRLRIPAIPRLILLGSRGRSCGVVGTDHTASGVQLAQPRDTPLASETAIVRLPRDYTRRRWRQRPPARPPVHWRPDAWHRCDGPSAAALMSTASRLSSLLFSVANVRAASERDLLNKQGSICLSVLGSFGLNPRKAADRPRSNLRSCATLISSAGRKPG